MNNMDSLRSIASSGINITLSPTHILITAGLLGIVLVSNAKSLLFAWHVKSPPSRIMFHTDNSRDDSSYSLHGISFYDGLSSQ
jgi:hypothetical protein